MIKRIKLDNRVTTNGNESNINLDGFTNFGVGTASIKLKEIGNATTGIALDGVTSYLDNAAAGAAGLVSGEVYQTNDTGGVAPFNVAEILTIKQ